MEKNKPLPNSIRALRKKAGMTLEEVAEKVGTDARTIQRIETGKMRLSDKWIGPIAAAIGALPGDLLVTTTDPAKPAPPRVKRSEVRIVDIPAPATQAMPKDLPVMGTAAGSHLRGAFQLDTHQVIDMVRRPPALFNVPQAYALYIEGNSMEPLHNNGDLRIVHPGRPVHVGDSVIVQMLVNPSDGMEATIGIYMKKTDKGVTIRKLNPEATILLEGRFVSSVHKVLTINDLFGV